MRWFTMVLIVVWMAMAPIPVGSLLPRAIVLELTIVSVLRAEVEPVGMVLAVIPLMVVTMVAIVIAGMIAVAYANGHFLGSARPGCHWRNECRSQKNKA